MKRSGPERRVPAEPRASPDRAPALAEAELQTARSEEFEALVEKFRDQFSSGGLNHIVVLEDVIRRKLGLAPSSAGAMVFTGLIGLGIRLLAAVAATVIAGRWAEVPWGRWAVVLGFYAVFDAVSRVVAPPVDAPPRPSFRRVVEDWTALLPTITRESDLRDLAGFLRRWDRWSRSAGVGVVVAAVMLLACRLVAPAGMRELPAGSVVLLTLLLYDFGTTPIYWGNILNWAFMAREAEYDHHLFWPSPADAPEVQKAMRKATVQPFIAGMWITVFLVLTVVLVSWDSPLVMPLGVGFVVIGYFSTIGLVVSGRASVRRIVERIRRRRLEGLQARIDAFGPRYTELSPRESAQLRDLLFLHDKIRDAPSTPTTTHTVVRAAVGLIVPSIMFVITVFGEVSAERILDAFLP